MAKTKTKASNMPVVVIPKQDDSRGTRLAELISARETVVLAEKEHRAKYKDILKAYDNDIRSLAMEINSNQAPLFDSTTETIDVNASSLDSVNDNSDKDEDEDEDD